MMPIEFFGTHFNMILMNIYFNLFILELDDFTFKIQSTEMNSNEKRANFFDRFGISTLQSKMHKFNRMAL